MPGAVAYINIAHYRTYTSSAHALRFACAYHLLRRSMRDAGISHTGPFTCAVCANILPRAGSFSAKRAPHLLPLRACWTRAPVRSAYQVAARARLHGAVPDNARRRGTLGWRCAGFYRARAHRAWAHIIGTLVAIWFTLLHSARFVLCRASPFSPLLPHRRACAACHLLRSAPGCARSAHWRTLGTSRRWFLRWPRYNICAYALWIFLRIRFTYHGTARITVRFAACRAILRNTSAAPRASHHGTVSTSLLPRSIARAVFALLRVARR